MQKTIKSLIKTVLNLGPSWLCEWEFRHQRFYGFNERPVELAFVFRKLAEIYPRNILDVGTGTTALPHLMRNCGSFVTAVDNVRGYWSEDMFNRHYHVIDDDITDTRIKGPFDLITCISVLEHIEKSDHAVRNMFTLLNPNGHLILTFPYSEQGYVRNVYELPGSNYGQDKPYITQSYSRTDLDRWLRENRGVIAEQEYWQFWEGGHWTVGPQIVPPRKVGAGERHQLSCIHITKQNTRTY